MHSARDFLVLVGLTPLVWAWWANRGASLVHALGWATAAWLAWGLVFVQQTPAPLPWQRYLALSLTGCAGIAVLGARRPQVVAWNFVVLGLLGVMLLPVLERSVIGASSLDWVRMVFLGGTLLVGVLNYLPTRAAPAAVFLAGFCVFEMIYLDRPRPHQQEVEWLIVLVPWLGYFCFRRRANDVALFDRLWLQFRDRYGLFWSQRLREQFNHAARHAGWPVTLYWQGLVLHRGASFPAESSQEVMIQILKGVLKRFEPESVTGTMKTENRPSPD